MTRSGHAFAGHALATSLVACLLASPLLAAEPFTPQHVARLRAVGSVAISPDGQHVAYTLSVPRQPGEGDDGPAWSELHVVSAEGRSRPFITGEVSISNVTWTPDGQGIAFLAKRGKDKHKALYIIPIDGGEARKALEHTQDISSFALSPDGNHIAFLATEPDPEALTKLREKGFNQEVYEEDWKPTRLWMALRGDDKAKPAPVALEGSASSLSWSPDGARLAIALAPTPGVDDDYMTRKVHILDAQDGKPLAKLDNVGKLGSVVWSPDGRHLALIAANDLNDPAPGRLLVGSVEGGALRDLLPDYKGHVSGVSWKDPATLVYIGDEGVWTTLNTLAIDGTNKQTRLARAQDGLVITALDATPRSARVALIGESARHPSDVFLASLEGGPPNRLTDSNPWLADLAFAPQEVVSFKARDGLDLEGILIRPLEARPDAAVPLILYVHGGPEAHERAGWQTSYSKPGQVAAAKGYSVFYPNYRGSTGYGVAFSKLSQADPAGKEFDDLVDAVDHFIETGLTARDKVGITGGSYGGYASAWGATYYSDRFAAAVMFVGISDKIAKSGTTDIPQEEYLVHARKRPWDNWSFFLERSPIHHVQKSKTPLLILHGKDDPRVHPSQSLELYRYVKLAGSAPVRLVWYPGEGHGNRRAASRYDYNLRMLQWFDHYLKGPGGAPPTPSLEYPFEQQDANDSK